MLGRRYARDHLFGANDVEEEDNSEKEITFLAKKLYFDQFAYIKIDEDLPSNGQLTDEDIIGNIEAKNIDTSTDVIDDELVETITEPESIT
ncbi:hypothetical protein BpHYR1_041151 [Brachionus plicatilis]|uniref:Uncharacterized protein n=1 Tax=Brachionus plicatilis TaxID=10195 RepID=A0A3M7RSS5_BRAPC|nr:hypothetical protein BpHYR1_041151 [Brachionus plicatilis]